MKSSRFYTNRVHALADDKAVALTFFAWKKAARAASSAGGVLALTAAFRRRNWPQLKNFDPALQERCFEVNIWAFFHKPESKKKRLSFLKGFCFFVCQLMTWFAENRALTFRAWPGVFKAVACQARFFVGLKESTKESALLLARIQGCLAQRCLNILPIYQI